VVEELPLQGGNDGVGNSLYFAPAIILAHRLGRPEDGVSDPMAVEGHDSAISFSNPGYAQFLLLGLRLSITSRTCVGLSPAVA
jgi:hypothetical protein